MMQYEFIEINIVFILSLISLFYMGNELVKFIMKCGTKIVKPSFCIKKIKNMQIWYRVCDSRHKIKLKPFFGFEKSFKHLKLLD